MEGFSQILWLSKPSEEDMLLAALIGVSSAVVDNVPLVQASIEMFAEVPMDAPLWQLVALSAGTGQELNAS